jgi:hypothetical protein
MGQPALFFFGNALFFFLGIALLLFLAPIFIIINLNLIYFWNAPDFFWLHQIYFLWGLPVFVGFGWLWQKYGSYSYRQSYGCRKQRSLAAWYWYVNHLAAKFPRVPPEVSPAVPPEVPPEVPHHIFPRALEIT